MQPSRHVGLALLVLATAAAPACSKKKDEGKTGTDTGDKGSDTKGSDTKGSDKKAGPASGGVVKVDGSSTVLLISEAVAEEFDNAGMGQATVAESGTGGGLQKFCRGEIDVANASRPIKSTEAEACKAAGIEFIELPIAYDGLAVVVNPGLDFVEHLTVDELKKMWEPDSKINNWKQVREGFPDKELHLYGAGTDSGTYDYFTQAIVGKEHSSRGNYTASEDDNVLVEGVAGDAGALGFFGYAYYIANKDALKVVPIDDGKDDTGKGPILPTIETVSNGTYQPLSRPLFIYVSVKSLERGSVKSFVDFYLEQAAALSEEVKYIPLPAAAYDLVKKRFEARTVGSAFAGGSQVGVTIEKLLASEGK